MRAVLPQDGGNGLGDDQQIAERRPRVDVGVVELHPLVEVDFAAAVDLPQARDALRALRGGAARRRRSAPLRSAAPGAGPTSDMSPSSTLRRFGSSSMLVRRRKLPSGCSRGSLRILKTGPSTSLRCITLWRIVVRAVDHRAQLEHLEAPPVHADALLREERRAAGDAGDRDAPPATTSGARHDRAAAMPTMTSIATLERRPRLRELRARPGRLPLAASRCNTSARRARAAPA